MTRSSLRDLVHRALGQQFALCHHQDVAAEFGHIVQIVFDKAKRQPVLFIECADLVGELGKQGPVDAGSDFIQQDDFRVAHQRASQFDQFFLAAGKVAGFLVQHMFQFEKPDRFSRLVVDGAFFCAVAAASENDVQDILAFGCGCRGHQVFQNSKAGKLMRNLKRSRQPALRPLVGFQTGNVLPVEQNPSGTWPDGARNDVEGRGLAGPVGADQAGNEARADVETGVVDCTQAAKVDADSLKPDHVAIFSLAYWKMAICLYVSPSTTNLPITPLTSPLASKS